MISYRHERRKGPGGNLVWKVILLQQETSSCSLYFICTAVKTRHCCTTMTCKQKERKQVYVCSCRLLQVWQTKHWLFVNSWIGKFLEFSQTTIKNANKQVKSDRSDSLESIATLKLLFPIICYFCKWISDKFTKLIATPILIGSTISRTCPISMIPTKKKRHNLKHIAWARENGSLLPKISFHANVKVLLNVLSHFHIYNAVYWSFSLQSLFTFSKYYQKRIVQKRKNNQLCVKCSLENIWKFSGQIPHHMMKIIKCSVESHLGANDRVWEHILCSWLYTFDIYESFMDGYVVKRRSWTINKAFKKKQGINSKKFKKMLKFTMSLNSKANTKTWKRITGEVM